MLAVDRMQQKRNRKRCDAELFVRQGRFDTEQCDGLLYIWAH
jgi:hypothetical protein